MAPRKLPPIQGGQRLPKPSGPAIFAGSRQPPDALQKIAAALPKCYPLGAPQSTRGARLAGAGWPHGVLGPRNADHALPVSPFKPVSAAQAAAAAAATAALGEAGVARRKRRQDAALDDALAAPRIVPRYGCWRAFLVALCVLDILGACSGWLQYRYCFEPAPAADAPSGSWAGSFDDAVPDAGRRQLWESGSGSESWGYSGSGSASGSWSALEVEEGGPALESSLQIEGAISEAEVVAQLARTIALVTNATAGGLVITDVVYEQTVTATLSVPGGEGISQESADGLQFRRGVVGAVGSGAAVGDVAILARRRVQEGAATHRRQAQAASTEVQFTVASDRDLSQTVADAQFIGVLAQSINQAAGGANGGALSVNATAVGFVQQPSFATRVRYVVRAGGSASGDGSSEVYIDALKASIASGAFSDQLTEQLASSYPGLVITVRYTGQTCAGDPCGTGGSCSESSEAAGEPLRVCACQAGYSLDAAKNSCAAVDTPEREVSSWRRGLGDASALCWAIPPYVQLGDIRGARVWPELWRGGLARLEVYFALAVSDMPKAAQGQDLWVLAVLRLLLLLPLRLLLDRMTRSPTPQPAQFKFILSNDHLSDEIQEILQLRQRGGGKQGAGHVTHKFKTTGGQGGWRMVNGTLAPSRRFETGAVGEDIHYITASTIPELQHQFHKRLQLPTKTAWPESRVRLAVIIEPERPAELKHPLDENDPAVGRTDPEEDDMSARQEPDDAPAVQGPSHGDWAGWGLRELTTLEDLKPAPVVHRLAVTVGLPYDTELAVPRRGATFRVWKVAGGIVCLVCCLSLGLAAAKIALLNRGELELTSDDSVGARAVRVLGMTSMICTASELSAFLGWLVWLRQHGVVPPSAEFPRPPRRCCCGKRGAVSVRPEPAAVPTGPTSSTAPTGFSLPPPPNGWRGLWGGVALYEWVVRQQRKLGWISCVLLCDFAATTVLFISLGYCAGSVNQDELGSDSGSGSDVDYSAATDGLSGESARGVLCWVVPPGLTPPLTSQTVLEDWAAEGWGSDGDGSTNYEATTAQGDLVLLAVTRALLLLVLLMSGAGMHVPDLDPKPRNKVVQLFCSCIFKGLLKGCGCGDGSRDEGAIIDREVLKRKREDAQGVPRWRKQRWCLLLGWGTVTLFVLLIKLVMMAGWGGCGEDEGHRRHSFMEHRCETVAGGAAGFAFGSDDDAGRPFDLRGAPNALLLGYTVCVVGFLEVIGLLGLGWRLDKRPKRVVPEQDALRRALLQLIEDDDDNLGAGNDADAMNDDSAAARRVTRWLLALEVSGVLEDGGPALFDWMESILPKDPSIVPVRYVLKEARERIKRKQHTQSERDRMAEAKLSVQERGSALLKGELDPGDAGGGHIGLGSGDGADVHQANSGWRWLEHTWGKYLSYHVSADRYSAPWSAAEHTVLAQLAGDRSLTWTQKAARLQELVSGAPRRSPPSVKRRWVQLERLANQAGWRCAESGTYRVAGWANDATGEWMWEYPLDTAG